MRLLGRYVFREILTSSLLGTLLATFVIYLHEADNLFTLLVGTNPQPAVIAKLLLMALPAVLPFTIPFGVLIGILIGLGRMSSDGEIVAMRAAGVSSRKVILPVLLFAALGMGLSAWASLRLTPYAYGATAKIRRELVAKGLSPEIQARVFHEDFQDFVVYVGGVRCEQPGRPCLWQKLFIADVTAPEKRANGLKEKADGPRIITAREAYASSDPEHNRLQLKMADFSSHEMSKDRNSSDYFSPTATVPLDVRPAELPSRKPREMSTRSLFHYVGKSPLDTITAGIELHQRFSFPVGCVMLALVGIPLGIATRKGGRSAAYLVALFLGFFCYYVFTTTMERVAAHQSLPLAVAMWLPNVVFGLAGIVFLSRMERPGERDFLGMFQRWISALFKPSKPKDAAPVERPGLAWWRIPLLPQLLDTYLLSNFLFYFVVVLATFVSMFLAYNFFELTGDMINNKIGLPTMFTYLFFLSPYFIYDLAPICILVAVLANLGTLSKQNEITAFRACGVSLHRLAMPILLVSTLFSGALFAFDYSYLPAANRKQDKLRDQIKGRPAQTYFRPDRKWTMGDGENRIYYYKYFDTAKKEMAGEANVYELDPRTYRVIRQIRADGGAHWNSEAHTWVFENGWYCDFGKEGCNQQLFVTKAFQELTEPPDYFVQEYLQDTQMNFKQLRDYIEDLQHSGYGYDTVKLEIQLYRKFAVPISALIMAMIGIPFAFMVGNRGAMTGIGVSIAIALSFQATSKLFEKIGAINELQPAVAAWGPDVIFGLAGLYFLLRMRS